MDGRAECGSTLPLLFHPRILFFSLSIFLLSFSLPSPLRPNNLEELLFRDLGRDDARSRALSRRVAVKGLVSVFPILDRHGGMSHDVVDG